MRRTREARSQRIALLALAFAAVCVVLLAGCVEVPLGGPSLRERIMPKGADHPASTAPTSTPATSTAAGAMTGTWLKAGSWKVTVARTRDSSKGPGGIKAGKGKRFLLVEVEIKNDRMTETLVVNPKDFSLKNSSGKKIAAVGRASGYNGAGMREIGPGFGGWTTFAYRIREGSSGYTLTFSPKVLGKRAKLQWGVP